MIKNPDRKARFLKAGKAREVEALFEGL
jgi:hypothetical protein